MITQAASFAERAVHELVTAKQIDEAGGTWNHECLSWVFSDGSKGAFTKRAAFRNDGDFDHYLFAEN